MAAADPALPQVVAGVAMTNLPAIVVLAFAKAQLVQIFFFRLNLLVTLAGLAHGLLFLPVLLSYVGKSRHCAPHGHLPSPRVPQLPGTVASCPPITGPAPRAAPGDTELALPNPCFEDKDMNTDKDKGTVAGRG